VTSDEDPQAYLDELVAARGYVLDYHKALAVADLAVLKATNELVDATYLRERTLDRRTKELLFVVALVVSRASKAHVQSHIRVALEYGASPTEILEAIEITLPEAGVVAFQAGFEAWREVVGVAGIQPNVRVHEGGSGID
jgi:4-carboxymuconolactone decarboxylase